MDRLFGIVVAFLITTAGAHAADLVATDLTDPTPVSQRGAVEGINFSAAANIGKFDGRSNKMFVGSVGANIPFLPETFGFQIDLAAGRYDGDYTSAGAALHLFTRDLSVGMVGIYGDWIFTSPEHSGRVGLEGAIYNDRVTLDVLAGVRFGQNVETSFFDEVDLSYYFTDNFRASVGHRWNARGHVANISFEAMADDPSLAGWSVFGEAEAGEDDYQSVFGGIRYSFGSGPNNTLIERDRAASVKIRVPRSLADITQCGYLRDSKPANFWRSEQTTLCSDRDTLRDEDARIEKR